MRGSTDKPLKIWMATPEVAGAKKSGGMADMAAAKHEEVYREAIARRRGA